MTHTLFRSPCYETGATRLLGSLHFHIDVSGDLTTDEELVAIAKRLDARGITTKVTQIVGALKGKHFEDAEFAAEYLLHTPELQQGRSTFTSYLTALLPAVAGDAEFESIGAGVRNVLEEVLDASTLLGAVVEIERVCARMIGSADYALPDLFAPFAQPEIGLNFESHHFIDIPNARLSLEQWVEMIESANVSVGGWFKFQKSNVEAFRSVTFDRHPNIAQLKHDHAAICARLDEHGLAGGYSAEAVIEQVVDIWKIETRPR